jgi:hypothetical protein
MLINPHSRPATFACYGFRPVPLDNPIASLGIYGMEGQVRVRGFLSILSDENGLGDANGRFFVGHVISNLTGSLPFNYESSR